MPHIDNEGRVSAMKGSKLTKADTEELEERIKYAQHWLQLYSPEKFRFEIQESLPPAAKSFSSEQKKALMAIHEYLKAHEDIQGEELHSHIHEIKKELNIAPADLFSAIYVSILGKTSGPQAGWFLTALDRKFVLKRLEEASAT